MPNIPCSEPGCKQVVTDPCASIISLFEMKEFLEDMLTQFDQGSIPHNKTLNRIDAVQSDLDNYELENESLLYNEYKMDSLLPQAELASKPVTKKTLVLECALKHRNTYVIECSA